MDGPGGRRAQNGPIQVNLRFLRTSKNVSEFPNFLKQLHISVKTSFKTFINFSHEKPYELNITLK